MKTFYFPSNLKDFGVFFLLTALARTTSAMLNRSCKKKDPCLVPVVMGTLHPFTVIYDDRYQCFIDAPIELKKFLSIPSLLGISFFFKKSGMDAGFC